MENILPIRKCISAKDINAKINDWVKKSPEKVHSRVIGKSGEHDIHMVEMTDPSVSREEKEIVMVIAMHTGMEISGGNTVFSVGNFLLSKSPVAKDILKKQVVVLIPCPNVYSYAQEDIKAQFRNQYGYDEYCNLWKFDGVSDPEKSPAAKAVQDVIDSYQPDALMDCHGVWYDKQLVIETISISAFGLNKSYNKKFMDAVQAGAEEAGYALPYEEDRQKLLPTDKICREPKWKKHFQLVAEGCTPYIYSYVNYHTLGATMEVAFEESGFLRVKRMLELGNTKWENEYYPGYPNRNIVADGIHLVTAWGISASQRRKSRVEIWNKIKSISYGIMHPEVPEKLMFIFSTSSTKCKNIFNGIDFGFPIQKLIDKLENIDGFNTVNMRSFMEPDPGYYCAMSLSNEEDTIIENGYSLKIRILYNKLDIESILLNGNLLDESEYDGYVVWKDNNWTFIQVNIPQGKTLDFAVVMVKYKSLENRKFEILEFD